MEYELRLFDRALLRFEADKDSADPGYRVTWVDDAAAVLLPHGLEPTAAGIARWVSHRAIPKNRAFVNTFLARSGLSANRPLGIITVCKGLSLNDCYWVCEAGSEDAFAKVNLYENRMSQLLANIAFTGYGSSPRNGFSSSPISKKPEPPLFFLSWYSPPRIFSKCSGSRNQWRETTQPRLFLELPSKNGLSEILAMALCTCSSP
jgi:hypothetical protein